MTQTNRVRGKRPLIENNCLENRCANNVYIGDNVHASRDFTPKNCSDVPGVSFPAVRVRCRVQANERLRPAHEAACAAGPLTAAVHTRLRVKKMLAAAHGQLPEVQATLHFKMAMVAEREGWPGDYIGSQGRSLRNRQRGRARRDQPKQCRSQPSHSVVLSGMRFGQTRTISRASLFFKDTPCSVLLHAKRDIRPLPRPPQNRQRLRYLSKRDSYDRTIRSRRRKYRTRTAARRA